MESSVDIHSKKCCWKKKHVINKLHLFSIKKYFLHCTFNILLLISLKFMYLVHMQFLLVIRVYLR